MKDMPNKNLEKRKILKKFFLDTNVLLDYLYFRDPDAFATEKLFEACVRGEIGCYIAAHSLINIFYITRKDYNASIRNRIIANFCSLCIVVELNRESITKAIEDRYSEDLEDAVQIQSAIDSDSDYIVTRDKNGFNNSPVKAITASEALRELDVTSEK